MVREISIELSQEDKIDWDVNIYGSVPLDTKIQGTQKDINRSIIFALASEILTEHGGPSLEKILETHYPELNL